MIWNNLLLESSQKAGGQAAFGFWLDYQNLIPQCGLTIHHNLQGLLGVKPPIDGQIPQYPDCVIGRFCTLWVDRFFNLWIVQLEDSPIYRLPDSAIYGWCPWWSPHSRDWQIAQFKDSQILQSMYSVLGRFHTWGIDKFLNWWIDRCTNLWIVCQICWWHWKICQFVYCGIIIQFTDWCICESINWGICESLECGIHKAHNP